MRWAAAGVCAVAGLGLFQFFGNATRGYVDTSSVFWWWISQWLNPQAETEHGWLILGLSGWLWWRNLRRGAESPVLRAESGKGADGSRSRREGAGGFLKAEEGRAAAVSSIEGERQVGRDGRLGEASLPGFVPGVVTQRCRGDYRGRGAAAPWVAMIAGLGLHVVGFVGQQTRVSIVAGLLFAWGVVRLGGGKRWGDAAMFPLGFMVFAIPLNVLDSVGFWLRLWVVDAAGLIAQVAGIEIVRSGTQLFSADGRYQYDVAAACSGVRSLMALAALSLLVGYLNFRSGWRRALMFGLCFPLTYLGNVARIAAIIFAAEMGGQVWGERAHDVMGFGVFVIVLGGVIGAARVVERWAPERAIKAEGSELSAESLELRAESSIYERRSRSHLRLGLVGVVILVVGEMFFLGRVGASLSGAAGVRLAEDGVNPVELPAFVGTEWIGRRTEVTAVERDILPADTGFSRRNYVHVAGGGHAVFLSIVLSGRDRTSIHRPELCLVGQGWTIEGAGEHAFAWPEAGSGEEESGQAHIAIPATLLRTERMVAGKENAVRAVVAYWFVNSERVVSTHWERAFWDTWNRVRHGRADRWAYVLMQADAADGEAAALARMQAVLEETWPVFQAVRG